MQYSYIARQPILDKNKQLFAYELLFRDSLQNRFPNIDASVATSQLISDNFLNIHNKAKGNKLSFVNFPYQALIEEIPTLLPIKNVVIEILETCQPSDELLRAVTSMWNKGYQFALDDFIPTSEWNRFLPYVSYIKFDINDIPISRAKDIIQRWCSTDICFIAERIETYEEFTEAKEAGFELFQGYFFSTPEMLTTKKLDPIILNMVKLFKATIQSPINFVEIENIIAKDVSLSYKLLTLVNNSPSVKTKIHSFKQAIAYLGEDKLRKFVSLLILTTMSSNKPQYLYNLSIQTARFCERLTHQYVTSVSPGAAFMAGMFCYLESLLDHPIGNILDELSIEDSIKQALLYKKGILGDVIELAQAYAYADWAGITKYSDKLEISANDIARCYSESILWTAELF